MSLLAGSEPLRIPMADDSKTTAPRPPMNVYTAMLLLSFVAVSSGCLILALDLFFRRMPLPLKP